MYLPTYEVVNLSIYTVKRFTLVAKRYHYIVGMYRKIVLLQYMCALTQYRYFVIDCSCILYVLYMQSRKLYWVPH